MEALRHVPYIFLMLAIAGIVAGASLITIDKFENTVDCASDNETCYALLNVTGGLADVAEQFPTIGIIAVMVIIISLIAGIFTYMKFFG